MSPKLSFYNIYIFYVFIAIFLVAENYLQSHFATSVLSTVVLKLHTYNVYKWAITMITLTLGRIACTSQLTLNANLKPHALLD